MTSPHLEFAGRTDIGRSRRRNEDAFFAGTLHGVEGWTLLAVADGLGGHVKGDWASERTLELLPAELSPLLAEFGPEQALREGCHRVNWALFSEARAMNAHGAATTLVATLIGPDEAWWMNVGDSRVYRHSGGELTQISRDHSWVMDQVEQGYLTAAEARYHPNRNVVTRTIGFEASVSPDIGRVDLEPGDRLLLCSDGLFGPVGDAAIARIMGENPSDDACKKLIAAANEAGGPDNITVVVGRRRE